MGPCWDSYSLVWSWSNTQPFAAQNNKTFLSFQANTSAINQRQARMTNLNSSWTHSLTSHAAWHDSGTARMNKSVPNNTRNRVSTQQELFAFTGGEAGVDLQPYPGFSCSPWGSPWSLTTSSRQQQVLALLPGTAARARTHHPPRRVIRLIGKRYQMVIIAICINIAELIGSRCSLRVRAQRACVWADWQFLGEEQGETGVEEEATGLCGITLCLSREVPCPLSLQDAPLGLNCWAMDKVIPSLCAPPSNLRRQIWGFFTSALS